MFCMNITFLFIIHICVDCMLWPSTFIIRVPPLVCCANLPDIDNAIDVHMHCAKSDNLAIVLLRNSTNANDKRNIEIFIALCNCYLDDCMRQRLFQMTQSSILLCREITWKTRDKTFSCSIAKNKDYTFPAR